LDPGLVIAQVEHGPGMHGGILPVILVAIALVGVLAYLVHRGRRARDREPASDRNPESDRGPEA
jgi:hypothetical protein